MSYIDFDEKFEEKKSQFKRTEFLKLSGTHIIRVLPGKAYVTYLHWVNRVPLLCLEDECTLCKQNDVIRSENPDTYWKVKGYYRKSQTFYLNVLDRTPTKVCGNCGAENIVVGNVFPPTCSSCNAFITDVEAKPINKVKVLTRGKDLWDDITRIHKTNVQVNGEPIGITNYDLQIIVGSNKRPFPQALLNNNDVVEIDEEQLYDLEKAPITLLPDEMLEVHRGVSLKDIFASRANDDELDFGPPEEVDEVSKDLEEELANKVAELMG